MMLVSSLPALSVLCNIKFTKFIIEMIFCTIVGDAGEEKVWKGQLEDQGKITNQPSFKPGLRGQAGTE